MFKDSYFNDKVKNKIENNILLIIININYDLMTYGFYRDSPLAEYIDSNRGTFFNARKIVGLYFLRITYQNEWHNKHETEISKCKG